MPVVCNSDGVVCAQDEEIDQMHNMFARIGKEEYPVEDISAEDWLRLQARRSLTPGALLVLRTLCLLRSPSWAMDSCVSTR